MIEAVIFDMDGVLIDAKDWHFAALNRALRLFGTEISVADHLTTFDGLPTRRKLELLTLTENFPQQLHGFVNELKQIYTMEIVHSKCKPVFAHEYALSALKRRGFRVGVASNSVRDTVETMMTRAGLRHYLDVMLSNEDVVHAKPDPEIYLEAMHRLGVRPEATLIVEDNEHGLRAAVASGAHVMPVRGVEDVHLEALDRKMQELGGGLP